MLHRKVLLIVFLCVAVGCSSSSSTIESERTVTPTTVPETRVNILPIVTTHSPLTPTSAIVPTMHPSATPSPSGTTAFLPQPTATATLTPMPTLPPEEAETLILELLKNNAECSLPCWWGLLPGETSWGEAQNFLATFASEIDRSGPFNQPLYTVYVPVSEEVDPSARLVYVFRVHDGVIEMIRVVFPLDYVQGHTLSEILNTYNKPEEIWLRTFDRSRDMTLPFDLVLFYPQQGFMIRFRDNAELDGETVRGCFQNTEYPPELWLSSPNQQTSFSEAATNAISFGLDEEKEYLPLEDAASIDVETFFNQFSQPDNLDCLKTPASLWPSP